MKLYTSASKHRRIVLLVCITCIAAVLGQSFAQDDAEAQVDPQALARVEAAVDRALEYLATHQTQEGAWPHRISGAGPNNGINALCLLSFLGRGHAPNRGPYKETVDRAIQYIRSTQTETGLYKSPGNSHGPMYEHGLATLAMIEAYGFTPTDEMRNSVQKAIDVIVGAQNAQGGWRYQPHPADADLSVTVMQVVALRSALNARLNVPKQTLDAATAYVKACAVPSGGFSYQPGQGPRPAQSAAGALCMQLLGEFDDPTVAKALQTLHQIEYAPRMDPYFHYMNYYAMQAHFQAGEQFWNLWHPRVRTLLLATQAEDGSWPGYSEDKFNGGNAKCYSTALSVMTLEVYMHYLPAYQR